MAIDFFCGFECRIVTGGAGPNPDERHWDSVTGTPAISTTTGVRTDTAALRCNAAGAGVNLQKVIARTIVVGRAYFYCAALPSGSVKIMRHNNANGNLDLEVDASGNITSKAGAGANSSSAGTIEAGRHYRLDWLADTSGATASLKVRLDGGAEVSSTNAQASVNMTRVDVGISAASTLDAYYDDVALGDATGDYPIGAGFVKRMKPTRDGTHSFTAADFGYDTAGGDVATSATDVWTYVDDDNLTSITDGVLIRQKVIRSTGYVEVGFDPATVGHDAQGVMVVGSFHASATGANTCGLKMNDGGTLRNLTDEGGDGLSDYSNTSFTQTEKLVLTPPSGGTWTKGKIDALLIRWGYATDVVGIPYWDGLMLEVAYAEQKVPYRNPMPPLLAQ